MLKLENSTGVKVISWKIAIIYVHLEKFYWKIKMIF